jgi:hypothetical protein
MTSNKRTARASSDKKPYTGEGISLMEQVYPAAIKSIKAGTSTATSSRAEWSYLTVTTDSKSASSKKNINIEFDATRTKRQLENLRANSPGKTRADTGKSD